MPSRPGSLIIARYRTSGSRSRATVTGTFRHVWGAGVSAPTVTASVSSGYDAMPRVAIINWVPLRGDDPEGNKAAPRRTAR